MNLEQSKNESEIALKIAAKAHLGQKDKVGADYILHPLAVSEKCRSQKAKIVALLHDVVEDTNITLEDLKKAGIGGDCLEAVDCLTKRKDESIDNYLTRVASSDIAIEVKFCDMLHNADYTRFPSTFDNEEAERIVFRYADRMIQLKNKAGTKIRLLSSKAYDEVQRKIDLYLVRSGQREAGYKPPLKDIWFRIEDVSDAGTYTLYIFMFDWHGGLVGYYNVWIDEIYGSLQYVNLHLNFNKDIASSQCIKSYANSTCASAIERIEKHLDVLRINPDRFFIAAKEANVERVLNKKFG